MNLNKLFIGTSGFSYPHWRGSFYPQNLAQKDWFSFYVKHFKTVELNVSFYRLPKKATFEKWRAVAGPPAGGFVFSVKGSRFITHVKKLKDCRQPLRRLMESAAPLASAKTVVLFQLPPKFKANPGRLANFLKLLPKNWRYAFEFRNESWLAKEAFVLLKKHRAAVVFQDFPDWPMTEEGTADFVYLRFHGRQRLYSSCYTEKELKSWVKKIKVWQKQGKDVYAYFNNDAMGYAVDNAKQLRNLCLEEN